MGGRVCEIFCLASQNCTYNLDNCTYFGDILKGHSKQFRPGAAALVTSIHHTGPKESEVKFNSNRRLNPGFEIDLVASKLSYSSEISKQAIYLPKKNTVNEKNNSQIDYSNVIS